MKKLTLIVATVITTAGAASANCYSNIDRDLTPIEATTCFNGSCVDDVLLIACGGSLGFNAEFESGFRVRCTSAVEGSGYNMVSQPGECSYYLGSFKLKDEHLDLLTCNADGDDN